MHRSRPLFLMLLLTVWLTTSGFLPYAQSLNGSTKSSSLLNNGPALQTTVSFGKVYPGIEATAVPASGITLQWRAVEGYPGTVTYRYCLTGENKKNCPPGKWVRVGTATSANISNLAANTTYKWWVRAYNYQNVQIAEADGMPWTFTTMDVPGNFAKVSPATGSSGKPVNGVALTWGTSSTATSYQYCIDTANNNACDTSWVTASSGVTLTGLKSNTIYYWQVRAVNAGGATLADFGSWWQLTTVILPGVFGKLSPDRYAAGQPINGMLLTWNISTNASGYEYCVSTMDNSCSGTWQPVSATSATIYNLTYKTDYYWQVRALTPAGTTPADSGTWWKFTTQVPPPGSFAKTTPIPGASNLYTDVTFTWQPSSGAESYLFCLSTMNNDADCSGMPWDSVTGTSHTVYGLDLSMTWHWQVIAVNGTGTAEANTGTWWSFTTQPNPPLGFTKTAPANGARKTSTSLNLSWSPSATAGVTYQVCYDTSNNHSCDQNAWTTVTTGTSYPLSGLNNGATYYWQVRATNAGGTTYGDYDMLAWYSFTTAFLPPAPFNKIRPTNGSEIQPLNLTLEWAASSLGVTYEYCVSSTSGSCISPQGWVSTSSTSAAPVGLTNGTTYYWQVRAKNAEGALTDSNGGWWSFTTMLPAPAAFDKVSPENSGSTQPVNLTLQWSPSSSGSTYEVCYDTTLDSTCDQDNWRAVPAGTSLELNGLEYGATYSWQVRAKNSEGTITESNGGWWSFTTQISAPAGFGKAGPANTLTPGTDINLTLTWTPSATAGAVYAVCYDKTGDSICDNDSWHTTTASASFALSGLEHGTTYYWQVRAANAGGNTYADGGAWWSFKTNLAAPSPFSKSSPAVDVGPQPIDLTLQWAASDPDASYEVCYDTTGDSICDQDNWRAAASGTSYTLSNLYNGTTYYWQVRAKNSEGTITPANGGTWWSFTTKRSAPIAFDKTAPKNESGRQPLNLTLEWAASDPGVTYEFCVSSESGSCVSTQGWVSVSSTSAVPAGLAHNTTYYWQVRAKNSEGTATNATGDWWSFTTLRAAPATFDKASPENGAGSQPVNLTLQWAASDVDASYEVCFDTTDDSSCEQENWQAVPSGTSFDLTGLKTGATYYWQVRSKNSEGTFTPSNGGWWHFSTQISAPAGFDKTAPVYDMKKTDTSLNITWTPSTTGGAVYSVCYDTSDDNSCENDAWLTASEDGSYPLTGLDNGTTYYWQVRAVNAGGTTYANASAWWSFTTKFAAPQDFSKSRPAVDAGPQPVNLTLQWAASGTGATYEVCYDTTSDNACDQENWRAVSTGTTFELTGLSHGTTYSWQVRARNSEGTITQANGGTWWSFTTQISAPANFDKTGPIDGAKKTAVSLSLTWTPFTTAGTTYAVCYDKTDNDLCDEDAWQSAETDGSYPLTGLEYGTDYFWQVRASNAGGYKDANAGDWWQFTTMLAAAQGFGKIGPEDGKDSLPIDFTLEWAASSQGASYEVCYDTTDDDLCDQENWKAVPSGTSFDLTGLNYATTYFWQVRAKNSEGTITHANDGTWWHFRTYSQPPTDFVKISPDKNAINQAVDVTLRWSPAGEGFTYEYCLGQALPLTCETWTGVDGTSVKPSELAHITTYYWQVRAKDPSGHPTEANDSEVWKFSTRPAPPTSSSLTIDDILEDHAVSRALQGADQYTFALSGSAPAGALDLQPSGHFTYTPPSNFSGEVTFQFTVSDSIGQQGGPYTVKLNYQPVNDPPVLNPVSVPATVVSSTRVSFTATASDIDLAPGEQLTFLIDKLPAGATFNAKTGEFNWVPLWSMNGQNTYQFTLSVSDGYPNDKPSQQQITITVMPIRVFLPTMLR